MADQGMTDIWSFEAQAKNRPRPVGEYAPLPERQPKPETGGAAAPWEDRTMTGAGALTPWQPPDVPAPVEHKPGGFWSGAIGQAKHALKTAVGSSAWSAYALNAAAGGNPDNPLGRIAKIMSTVGEGEEDQPAVGDYRKINDINSALTYAGEGVGMGVGSVGSMLIGGGAGAAVGAAVPIPGAAAVGFGTGLVTSAMMQNHGDMASALFKDEEIQKAIKEGRTSEQAVGAMSILPGMAMGALDTAALGKLAKITGIGEKLVWGTVKNAVKDTVKMRLLKGAAVEGSTEGLQQIIEEATRTLGGGKKDIAESTAQVINAAALGAIPGALFGMLPGGHHAAPAPTPTPPPPAAPAAPGVPPTPQPHQPGYGTPGPQWPYQPQPGTPPPPTGTPPGQGPAPPPPGTTPGSVPPPMQGPPPGAPGSPGYGTPQPPKRPWQPGQGAPGQPPGTPPPSSQSGPGYQPNWTWPTGSPPGPNPNQPGQAPGTPPPPPQQPPGPGATSPNTPGGMGQPQGAPPGAQTANTTTEFSKNTATAPSSPDEFLKSIFDRLSPMVGRAAGEPTAASEAPIATVTTVSAPGEDLALAVRHMTSPRDTRTEAQEQPHEFPAVPPVNMPPEQGLGPSETGMEPSLRGVSEAPPAQSPLGPSEMPSTYQPIPGSSYEPVGPIPVTPEQNDFLQQHWERHAQDQTSATPLPPDVQRPVPPDLLAPWHKLTPEQRQQRIQHRQGEVQRINEQRGGAPLEAPAKPVKKGKAKAAQIKAKKAEVVRGPEAKRTAPQKEQTQLQRVQAMLKEARAERKAKGKPKLEQAKKTARKRAAKKKATKQAPAEPERTLPEPKGLEVNKQGVPIRRIYHGRTGPIEHPVKAGTERAAPAPPTYEPTAKGKVSGTVYVRHEGFTYAIPAGVWRQTMVKSFAKGKLNTNAFTEERIVEVHPDDTRLIHPVNMLRQDFKKEAERLFREQTGRHKQALYEHKYEPALPKTEEKEEPKKRRTVPAYSIRYGESEIAQPKPEYKPGPAKPVVPGLPESTGDTKHSELHSMVQARFTIFAEAMKALAYHEHYGQRMRAVQQTVRDMQKKLMALPANQSVVREAENLIRDTSNNPTVARWQKSDVGRAANRNLEALLRQAEREEKAEQERKHKQSVAVRQALEQAEGKSNYRTMGPDSHVWGQPIRDMDMREVGQHAKRLVERLAGDAPMFAKHINDYAIEREPVKDAKSGQNLLNKMLLDDKIRGMQEMWADHLDKDMKEHLAKVEKEAKDIEAAAQTTGGLTAKQRAVAKKAAGTNARAKDIVDTHLDPDTMMRMDWHELTQAVKDAYQAGIKAGIKLHEVSPDELPPYQNGLAHIAKTIINAKGNVKRISNPHARLTMMTEVAFALGELRADPSGIEFNRFLQQSKPTREEGPGKRAIPEDQPTEGEAPFTAAAAKVEMPSTPSPEEELIAKQEETLRGPEMARRGAPKEPGKKTGEAQGPWFRNSETGYVHRKHEPLTGSDIVSEQLKKTSYDRAKWGIDTVFQAIDKAMAHSLTRLVGDIRVVKLPAAELAKLKGNPVFGTFQKPTAQERAQGERGVILVDEALSGARYREVVMHEAIHAATHWAYVNNYNNTTKIIDELFKEAKKLADSLGHRMDAPWWESAEEWMTWSLSNHEVQKVMKDLRLESGSNLEVRVRDLKPGKFFDNVWAGLRATVAHLLGAFGWGKQGMSYLDSIMSVYAAQAQDAHTSHIQGLLDLPKHKGKQVRGIEMSEEGLPPRHWDKEDPGTSMFGPDMVRTQVTNAMLGLSEAVDSVGKGNWLRHVRLRYLSTVMGMMRMSEAMGMGPGHPLYEAMRSFMQKNHTRDELRKEGMHTAAELQQLARSPQYAKTADEAMQIIHGASRDNVDLRFDENHPKNSWMQGEGNLRHRLALQRWHARYLALPKVVRDAVDKIGRTYTDMQRDATREQTLSILRSVKPDFASIGTTQEDYADWVMGGGLARMNTAFSLPHDIAMAALLPDYAQTKITDAIDVNRMQGFFVPMTRRGDHVIRASRDYSQPQWLPKGANAIDENTFEFRTRAEYEAYVHDNDGRPEDERDHIRKVQVQYPAKTAPASAQPVYTVKVQNQYFSMWQNATEAERERDALIEGERWDTVTPVQHARGGIEKNEGMLPRHIQSAIEAMQSLGLKGSQLDTAKAALIQAQVQSMPGNTMAHHNRIQRQNVFGARAGEAVLALRDYTFGYSNLVAGFRHNPEIEELLTAAENELRRNQMDPRIKQKQELIGEMRHRQKSIDGYNHLPLVQNITTMTYVSQLLSVSNVILQLLQTVTNTWPHLAGQLGMMRATRLLYQAMRDIGVPDLMSATWSDLGVATGDIGRAVRGLLPELQITHANRIRLRLKGADLRAFEAAVKIGALDDTAGQEMDLSRLGKGRIENTLNSVANVVLSLTAGIEAMNRSAVLLAAMRGYMEMGMSEEVAIEKALHDIEQTQGIYSAANNPTAMQHPAGRVMFQFKKYALFNGNWIAKMIYHGFGGAKNLATGQKLTTEQRVQLRTIGWTLLAMGAMSGGGGAVPWEIIGLPLMMIQFLLGVKKPTDPADWMQEKTQQIMQYMGKEGPDARKYAEIIMHGLPRLMGLDLSDRVGFQNLASFGQPKSSSPDDQFAYLGRTLAGPFVGRAIDAINFSSSDKSWLQFPFLPKIIKDMSKAYDAASEGTFTKFNRRALEPYDPWETILKGSGFSTAEEKRQWEPGGAARLKQEEREATHGRADMMGRWYRADRLGDIAGREKVWREIQDWNTDQPRAQRIDRGNLYKLRQQRLLDEKKEHKKYGEAAYG